MAVITAIAVGAVVAGAAAYSATAQKSAADKAASAQKKAVNQQSNLLKNKLNPDRLNEIAQRFDKERAQSRLALQKELDPELAALREKGKTELLAEANVPRESRQSQQLATQLFKETKEQDPRIEALKQQLISGAERELAAGATLPPEFQGELVRAGLTKASGSGVGTDRNQVGPGIARVLGLAGIQLQEARQDQAVELTNAAQNITNSRVNILSAVFPKLRELEAVNRNEAAQNFALANALLPESGLSGQDAANIELAAAKAKAQLVQQQANIKAGEAQAQANFNSGLAGAAASGISGAAGAYTGGAGGAAGATNLGVGGTGAVLNTGTIGNRTPQQQSNFQFLQNYYS